MIKERVIPKHTEEYHVCDHCGQEIKDDQFITVVNKDDKQTKHFHHTLRLTAGGCAKSTCFDKYNNNNIKEAKKNHKEFVEY